MEYSTIGQKIHSGRIVELFIEKSPSIPEHCSNRLRLIIIEKGSVIISGPGGRSFIEAPALFCINNKETISIGENDNLVLRTIYFSPVIINSKFGDTVLNKREYGQLTHTETQDLRWLNPFVQKEDLKKRYIKLGVSSARTILKLSDLMENELKEQPDPFWPCRSRSFFLEILYSIYHLKNRYDIFKSEIDVKEGFFEKILVYLHSNYMEDITLHSLTQKFNLNRTKINKMFTNVTGQAVITYLINFRIKLACFILRDTKRPVKEIAYQTGFNDLSNFGRMFKKVTNYSPSQYREEYNWM